MSLIWPPRNVTAAIARTAIRARMSAYSARPWPASPRRWSTRLLRTSNTIPPALSHERNLPDTDVHRTAVLARRGTNDLLVPYQESISGADRSQEGGSPAHHA